MTAPRRRLTAAILLVVALAGVAALLATRHPVPGRTGSEAPSPTTPAATAGESEGVKTAIAQATASQDWLYQADDEVREAIQAASTTDAGDRLAREALAELDVARNALAGASGPVWWLVRPLAWRTIDRSGASMSVSVWTASILSARDLAAPQITFRTTTVDLVARDGRWLVANIASVDGPTPNLAPGPLPDDSTTFDDALDGYTRIGGSR
jgi:hypothetical protein